MLTVSLIEKVDAAIILAARISLERLNEIEYILQVSHGVEGQRLLDYSNRIGDTVSYLPSPSFITVMKYLESKYSDETDQLANFVFIIKSFYELDFKDEQSRMFIYLAAYMYFQIKDDSNSLS